nr:MAG TPA: InsA N-terminal domain [Caudoviricetes sp.]
MAADGDEIVKVRVNILMMFLTLFDCPACGFNQFVKLGKFHDVKELCLIEHYKGNIYVPILQEEK